VVAKPWKSPRGVDVVRTEVHADPDGRFTWNGDKKKRSIVIDPEYGTDGWTFTIEGDERVRSLLPSVPFILPHSKDRLFSRDSEGRGNLFLLVSTIPFEEGEDLYRYGDPEDSSS